MSDTHVDRKVLSDLQEVMEDEYIKLLETFLEDSEMRLNRLCRARDVDDLGREAHSFKGSASNMGAHRLAELCRQVEERVSQRLPFGIEPLIGQICREYKEVRQVFRDECERVKVS
mgnify:CR=1 FL=1